MPQSLTAEMTGVQVNKYLQNAIREHLYFAVSGA